jgi:flagellar hook-associated protein 3
MNVSFMTTVNQAIDNANSQTTQLSQLQEEASTGNALLEPSDNPTAAVAVLASQAATATLGTQLSNIQSATTVLNASSTATTNAANILSQAQQIAIQGAQTTNTPEQLTALADQVNDLLQQLLDAANTQSGSQYVFGGTATQTQPFVVSSTNSQGQPETISYKGTNQAGDVIVAQGDSVPTLYSGQQVFQSTDRGQTLYQGNTGAAAGTGTDSATGEGTLEVQHTSTVYAAGSGVAAGTSSSAGDTILGPAGANTLTITDTSGNGTAGTVSLNGGPAVAFTNTDTNLAVTAANGQVVYVNTTAIAPGFSGTVDITANGTLSTDGGATTVPIDFSSNQVVTNSLTGGVTNVNSTNISAPGTDQVEYQGTFNAFQALIALRDALNNTQGQSSTDQATTISNLIGQLQTAQNGLLDSTGAQSATLSQLTSMQTNFQAVQLADQQTTTTLQGADVTQVVVQLQAQQNLLQLTLSAAAETLNSSTTLLNFLQE